MHGEKNKDYQEDMLFLTEDECSDLINFIAHHSDSTFLKLVPICFFGIYYGLRRSEILRLKWDAIDFEKKTIYIQHTVVRVKTTEAKNSTKTASSFRTLALSYCRRMFKTNSEISRRKSEIFWRLLPKQKQLRFYLGRRPFL